MVQERVTTGRSGAPSRTGRARRAGLPRVTWTRSVLNHASFPFARRGPFYVQAQTDPLLGKTVPGSSGRIFVWNDEATAPGKRLSRSRAKILLSYCCPL